MDYHYKNGTQSNKTLRISSHENTHEGLSSSTLYRLYSRPAAQPTPSPIKRKRIIIGETDLKPRKRKAFGSSFYRQLKIMVIDILLGMLGPLALKISIWRQSLYSCKMKMSVEKIEEWNPPML